MTANPARTRASLEELQAAVAAAQRGDYALRRPTASRRSTGVVAPQLSAPAAPATGTSGWQPGGTVVVVIAGHSGAGASTVAVTLAEALQDSGRAVRIVEVADASRSGLAAATNVEFGEDGTGWRRGRRGDTYVDRLAFRASVISQVPAPAPAARPDEALVLDIGWPARDALAADGWLASALATASLLIVCRPTVPGIRQTEYLLCEIAEQSGVPVTLAAVGSPRWPGAAAASAGPQVRAARQNGRVISVPIDRRVETDGVSAEALPKSMAAAGRALVAALPSTAPDHHPTEPASRRAG